MKKQRFPTTRRRLTAARRRLQQSDVTPCCPPSPPPVGFLFIFSVFQLKSLRVQGNPCGETVQVKE